MRFASIKQLISTAAWKVIGGLVVVAVLIELGGIWNELRQLRNEQVKNALYTLPEERRASIGQTSRGKQLQNTVHVTGSVEVDGEVKVEEPIEVNLDH